MDVVLRALHCQNAASVKQFQEVVAVRLAATAPPLMRVALLPRLQDCSDPAGGRPELGSLLLVCAVGVMQLRPLLAAAKTPGGGGSSGRSGDQQGGQEAGAGVQEQEEEEEWRGLVGELVDAVTPWALSHVHALR